LDSLLKQRLVGAAVWIGIAVIFVPLFFDGSVKFQDDGTTLPTIPHAPAKPPIESFLPEKLEPGANLTESHHDIARKTAALIEEKPHPLTVRHSNTNKSSVASTVAPPVSSHLTTPSVLLKKQKERQQAVMAATHAYVLQLGSFTDLSHAQALQESLKNKGFPAFMRTGRLESGKSNLISRVYVGPVLKHDQVLVLQQQVDKSLGIKGKIMDYTPSSS
jgi:DedD protein